MPLPSSALRAGRSLASASPRPTSGCNGSACGGSARCCWKRHGSFPSASARRRQPPLKRGRRCLDALRRARTAGVATSDCSGRRHRMTFARSPAAADISDGAGGTRRCGSAANLLLTAETAWQNEGACYRILYTECHSVERNEFGVCERARPGTWVARAEQLGQSYETMGLFERESSFSTSQEWFRYGAYRTKRSRVLQDKG